MTEGNGRSPMTEGNGRSPIPHLAAVCRVAFASLVVVATAGGTGCKAPAGATASPTAPQQGRVVDRSAIGGATQFASARAPEIINAGTEKLVLEVTDIELELTSPRESQDFDEVTYVISLEDDASYNLQFSSAADREDFVIRVSFKRLYRGTYTVKAYGDKGTDAFAQASFRVNDEGL